VPAAQRSVTLPKTLLCNAQSILEAIGREKTLKKWKRKEKLMKKINPEMRDLSGQWFGSF
jgi:predicted GIY-YIG superfamily endonuclease